MIMNIEEVTKNKNYSKITIELTEELLKISRSEDFVEGTLDFADNEADRKALLDYVKENTRTYGDVVQMTYKLYTDRHGKSKVIIADDDDEVND